MVRTHGFWLSLVLGVLSAGAAEASKPRVNRPQRNNNPLNIKEGGATRKWIERGLATRDPVPAADGGHFLKFQDVKTGFQAADDLLRSGVYRNLDVERALRKWSGGGYGAEIAPDLRGKTLGSLTAAERARLIEAMARREGFYANGYVPPRRTPAKATASPQTAEAR